LSALQEAVGPAASASAALGGLVVAVGGLSLTPLAAAAVRAIVPERRVVFARWRFSHLFAVLLLAFAGAMLWMGVLQGLLGRADEVLLGQAATALGLGLAGLAILLLARRLDPQGLACLGLRSDGNGRAIGAGLLAYLLCGPALVGAMLLWPWLYERLGGQWSQQPIVTHIAALSTAGVVLLVVLAVLVQPLLEELLFRSFVQPLLVQNLGDRGGLALTSVLFASLHGGSAFLPVFGLSLLLGALMLRTQRLLGVWAVHAVHNGLMLVLVLLAPEGGGLVPSGEHAPGLLSLLTLLP
jgi:membrane protease YdiL (CAAX protease family)